jgi:hypothetical protein
LDQLTVVFELIVSRLGEIQRFDQAIYGTDSEAREMLDEIKKLQQKAIHQGFFLGPFSLPCSLEHGSQDRSDYRPGSPMINPGSPLYRPPTPPGISETELFESNYPPADLPPTPGVWDQADPTPAASPLQSESESESEENYHYSPTSPIYSSGQSESESEENYHYSPTSPNYASDHGEPENPRPESPLPEEGYSPWYQGYT